MDRANSRDERASIAEARRPGLPHGALLAALTLRLAIPLLAYACDTSRTFFHEPDTRAYLLTSESLLETGRFERAGEPEVFRTPGYPLFLLPGVALGRATLYAVVAQIALGLCTVVLVQRLAWLLFARRDIASAAAWLAACEPISILYASKLLTETLFTLLFACGVYGAAAYLRYDRLRALLVAAVMLAAATYVRPVAYYCAPLLMFLLAARTLWSGERRRVRAAHVVAFALLTVAAIAPWQVRNYVRAGYSGFTSWPVNAITYYATIVRESQPRDSLTVAMSRARFLDDVEYRDAHAEQAAWSPSERFAWQEDAARPVFRAAPGTTARIYIQGVASTVLDNGMSVFQGLVGPWIPVDDDQAAKAELSTLGRVWRAVQVRPAFVALYAVLQTVVLGYIGLATLGVASRRAVSRAAIFVVLAAIAYLLFVSGGPFGSHRMRVPIMPLVSTLGGAGLCLVLEVLHRRRNAHRAAAQPAD